MNNKNGKGEFTSRPLAERFWEKVHKTKTCWIWTGSNDGHRGQIRHEGRLKKAPRVALMLEGIEVPPEMFVCHRCDNALCVRPDHLFVGTPSDNTRDCVAKGRYGMKQHPERRPWGARNGKHTHPESRQTGDEHWTRRLPERQARGVRQHGAKLTDALVVEMRQAFVEGASKTSLSRKYGVRVTTITRVLNGRAWRHVPALASTEPSDTKETT